MKRTLFLFAAIFCALFMRADVSYEQCLGSARPYPGAKIFTVPDTLTPIYVSYIGRHGARLPSSGKRCERLRKALARADSAGTITPLGRQLLTITDAIIAESRGKWGALDSLGVAEISGIAMRLQTASPSLFGQGKNVVAISSYVPRCMMSMYTFTHTLDRGNDNTEFSTGTGARFNYLLRPFQIDKDYLEYRAEAPYHQVLEKYMIDEVPAEPIYAVLGVDYPFKDSKEIRELTMVEFKVLTALPAMGEKNRLAEFFTLAQADKIWRVFNLEQYYERTANIYSDVPAQIARPLLCDIIQKADSVVSGLRPVSADLRFGHAETMMPLLSLLRLPGRYVISKDVEKISREWRNFEVVPMAANLQFRFYRGPSGAVYVITLDNEVPVIPLTPWRELRAQLVQYL